MFLRLSAQGCRDLKVGHIQELLHWDSECELADHFARLPHSPCNSNCLINPSSAFRLGFPSSTPSQSMVVTKHSNDEEHGYNIGQAWKQGRRLILRFGFPTACHVMRTDPWFEQHCKRRPQQVDEAEVQPSRSRTKQARAHSKRQANLNFSVINTLSLHVIFRFRGLGCHLRKSNNIRKRRDSYRTTEYISVSVQIACVGIVTEDCLSRINANWSGLSQ